MHPLFLVCHRSFGVKISELWKSSPPAACFPHGYLITPATVTLGPWQCLVWLTGFRPPNAAIPSRSRWTSKQPDNNFLMQVLGAGAKHISFLTLPVVQRLMNRHEVFQDNVCKQPTYGKLFPCVTLSLYLQEEPVRWSNSDPQGGTESFRGWRLW